MDNKIGISLAIFVAMAAAWPLSPALAAEMAVLQTPSQGEAADYRKRAAALIQTEKFQDAYDLLLKGQTGNKNDVETNFLIAQAAFGLDRVEEAIERYQKILVTNPNLPRVRLELARGYAANQQNDLARQELNAVMASNPPQAVGENIQKFLAALDSQKEWTVRASLGYLYDSNVNAGPAATSVLMFGVPFTLAATSQPNHDSAITANVSASHVKPFSRAFAWQSDVALNHTDYNSLKSFNSDVISLSSGPSWKDSRYVFSLPVLIDHVEIGHNRYSESYGISPQAQFAFSQTLVFSGSLTLQDKSYASSPDRDGGVWSANGGLKVNLSEISFLQAGYRHTEEDAKQTFLTNHSDAINVGYYTMLPEGFALFVQPSASLVKYNEKEAAYDKAREDAQYTVNVNLSKNIGNTGFAFAFGYTYTRNDSNLEMFDYKREQVSAQISKVF